MFLRTWTWQKVEVLFGNLFNKALRLLLIISFTVCNYYADLNYSSAFYIINKGTEDYNVLAYEK